MCIDFYDLSTWGGCLFVVYIRRFIYNFFKCVSFWLHGCCGKWEGWAREPVNHTSWVALVSPTYRHKSVRKRCVIELFVGLFVWSICPFDISVGVGAFVMGLNQISSFFSCQKGITWNSICTTESDYCIKHQEWYTSRYILLYASDFTGDIYWPAKERLQSNLFIVLLNWMTYPFCIL